MPNKSTLAVKPDPTIRRALISVSDKTGIVEFAKDLHKLGIIILSTGGTANLLRQHGIPVTDVAAYTGFPEIFAGRVKTLHPKIHGGLLARGEQDSETLCEHAIDPIHLLIVNLYPFQEITAKLNCPLDEAIENIDIGGPAMLRGAAKNYLYTTVVVDPTDYMWVLNALKRHAATSRDMRFDLACKVFAHTAQYDGAIANYLGTTGAHKLFPQTYSLQVNKKQDLRYGENPHQQAAFYVESKIIPGSISNAEQLQGKDLSYNNIADTDTALQCVKLFCGEGPACVIVKHANPCGVAVEKTQLEAYQRAYQADPSSAFGGIIAFNTPLEAATAAIIIKQQFVEILIAPDASPEALAITAQKPNLRVLRCGQWPAQPRTCLHYEKVDGGLLVQQSDTLIVSPDELRVVSARPPSETELSDLQFAWKVVKFVKSNAIVYAKNKMTLGIGAGQTSRIMSANIAAWKAKAVNLEVQGAAMASDAFFPFRDSIDAAAKAGITAIIQPGGSIRDHDVIAAANEHNITMIFTAIRHFRH